MDNDFPNEFLVKSLWKSLQCVRACIHEWAYKSRWNWQAITRLGFHQFSTVVQSSISSSPSPIAKTCCQLLMLASAVTTFLALPEPQFLHEHIWQCLRSCFLDRTSLILSLHTLWSKTPLTYSSFIRCWDARPFLIWKQTNHFWRTDRFECWQPTAANYDHEKYKKSVGHVIYHNKCCTEEEMSR